MRVSIRKYIGALCKITVYTVTNRKSNVIPCKKRKQWTVYNLRFERFLRKNVIRRCRFAPIWALLDDRNRGGADGGNPGPIRPSPSPSGTLDPQPTVELRATWPIRSRTGRKRPDPLHSRHFSTGFMHRVKIGSCTVLLTAWYKGAKMASFQRGGGVTTYQSSRLNRPGTTAPWQPKPN